MPLKLSLLLSFVLLDVFLVTVPARAEEGMWLYNHPPTAQLRQRFGWAPNQAWLDNMMRSSVRFNNGGSGSFVSANGLVMTNHHVAVSVIENLSTPERNYMRDGFHARTLEAELPAGDLELNVLMSIEDVSARVDAAVRPNMTLEQQWMARRAVIATIERESLAQTGFRSNVVKLYQGGQYHLYRYKRYTDVRLVFAPEKAAAFFGGDPDNFQFPRYDLDVTFFRVYENGRPVQSENFLRWSMTGPRENELTIVSGHPGGTSRVLTTAAYEYSRDHGVPQTLARLQRLERLLLQFGERGEEARRRAEGTLFSVQNSRTVLLGHDRTLRETNFIAMRAEREEQLRATIASRPELRQYNGAWDTIVRSRAAIREIAEIYNLLEGAQGIHSRLFDIARTLVRLADENQLPDDERLTEFQEARRPELELGLFSNRPIYPDLQEALLAGSLAVLRDSLGADHEAVRIVLQGQTPEQRAAALVSGTGLADVGTRRALAAGGREAIAASTDPMIVLARNIDAISRSVGRRAQIEIGEAESQAYAQIYRARNALGQEQYPDATFTLRLSFGVARGYAENGNQVPWMTTIGGTFEHETLHNAQEPWLLPQSWHRARPQLNLATPFNFVSTNDIIGGNSGSPVVNRNGEVIGLVFDGNKYSLAANYLYDDVQARSLSVTSNGIAEALRGVYRATELLAELRGECAYGVQQ